MCLHASAASGRMSQHLFEGRFSTADISNVGEDVGVVECGLCATVCVGETSATHHHHRGRHTLSDHTTNVYETDICRWQVRVAVITKKKAPSVNKRTLKNVKFTMW